MKKRLIIFLLFILGLGSLAFGLYFKFFNNEKYGDVLESYEGFASLKEKNGKAYASFKYTNTNKKAVIIKKVKLAIANPETKDIFTKDEIIINEELKPGQSKTINFKLLDKSKEELDGYYPEIDIE